VVGVGGRPVVYLVGTAGHPHYGDEVITAGWLRFYAEAMPDAEVWLDTPRPGQTAVLHGGSHPRLRCVDTLYHACWNAPSQRADDCVAFGAEVIDNPGRLAREASGFTAAGEAALVHLLGGSYLSGLWPRHVTLLAAARRVGERTGARLAMTGADLLPAAPDSAPALQQLTSAFDVVDVRTQASAALLGTVPATVTGDDALLDLQRQRIDARARAATVIEIQNDLLEVPLEQLAAQAVRLVQAWGKAQEPVLLLESLPPGDTDVLPMLREHLPHLEVLPFELLWRNGFPVQPDRCWITTRFHTHLMAAASGSWGAALSGSPVLADQHASLLELGTGWALSRDSHDDVPAGQPGSQPYDGRFGDLTAAKRAVAESVLDRVRR
jgi:hypothetical protein